MLFVFPSEGFHRFWMKDVSFPLDLLYIAGDGTIVDVQRMEPEPGVPDAELTIYEPPVEVLLAMEINGGLARRHGIEARHGRRVRVARSLRREDEPANSRARDSALGAAKPGLIWNSGPADAYSPPGRQLTRVPIGHRPFPIQQVHADGDARDEIPGKEPVYQAGVGPDEGPDARAAQKCLRVWAA